MLKYLKIKNFLSFKNEIEINFESSHYGKNNDTNVFDVIGNTKKNTLMKSMIIYGANASGKSNILKAFGAVRNFVLGLPFFAKNFAFDKNNNPITFEIGFFVNNNEYKYFFKLASDKTLVLEESLNKLKGKKEENLFSRSTNKIVFNNELKKYSKLPTNTLKENVSLIWFLSQYKVELIEKSIQYFFQNINIIDNNITFLHTIDLLKLTKTEKNKNIVIEFLKCADIDICDIKIDKVLGRGFSIDLEKQFINFENNQEQYIVRFGHKIKGSKEIVYLDLGEESQGTRKLFNIIGPIFDAILNEKILFIDEIESNLHPHIIKNIFKIIHNDLGKNYQFIFTSHNTEFMNLKYFKKEQIGFTDKTKENSGLFYTLYDFEDLRKENDIQKFYNLGKLGGIPLTEDFISFIQKNLGKVEIKK